MRVSRTVIRDAVRALAAKGLVDVRRGIGTTVTVPSPRAYAEAALTMLLRSDCTLGDLWAARQMLDSEMVAAAIHSDSADWTAAEDALDRFERAVVEKRWDDVPAAHEAFHVGLMTATGNPVIELLLGPMHQIIPATASAPDAPDGAGANATGWRRDFVLHRPILDAAKAGDEAAMRKAVAAHYGHTERPKYRRMRDRLLRDSPAARAALLNDANGG
jgi:DNA-binding FadR family transcriptional regulator